MNQIATKAAKNKRNKKKLNVTKHSVVYNPGGATTLYGGTTNLYGGTTNLHDGGATIKGGGATIVVGGATKVIGGATTKGVSTTMAPRW